MEYTHILNSLPSGKKGVTTLPVKFLETDHINTVSQPHFPFNLVSEKLVENLDLKIHPTFSKEVYSDFTKTIVLSNMVVLTPIFKMGSEYLALSDTFYVVSQSRVPGGNILFGSPYSRYGMSFTPAGVYLSPEACKPYLIDEKTLGHITKFRARMMRC